MDATRIPPLSTDPGIASQIKATLTTLLEAGAATEPSRWVTLCSEVVMAAAPGSTAAAEQEAADTAEQDSDDDEEGAVARAAPVAPPSPGPSAAAAGAAAGKGPTLSPRLRTRLFAAQLLLRVPGLAAGGDPRQLDLGAAQAAARAGGGGDWLVLRLQQLVDLAFRMASGQLEVGGCGRGCGCSWLLGWEGSHDAGNAVCVENMVWDGCQWVGCGCGWAGRHRRPCCVYGWDGVVAPRRVARMLCKS
jgi:hypothetical protein